MKSTRKNPPAPRPDPALEETLRLYHAWLGYLLRRMGCDTLRVAAGDIRRALEGFSCSVSREGEEYVIRMTDGEVESPAANGDAANGEAAHG